MKRALLVGIDDYPGSAARLHRRRHGDVVDARPQRRREPQRRRALRDQRPGGGRPVGLGHPSGRVFESAEDADLLFYFAGHGAQTPWGAELVTQDAITHSLGVSLADVIALANGSPARDARAHPGLLHQRGSGQRGRWAEGRPRDPPGPAVFSVDKLAVETPKNWLYPKGASPAYTITSAANSPALWGTFQTVTYNDGVTVKGMVTANIITCKGDSGGPLYANHKAYGITTGTSLVSSSCETKVYFTPVSTAIAELGVQLLLA